MPNPVQAVSVGAIILFVVVAMPALVSSATGLTEHSVSVDEGETVKLTDRINITVENIQKASGSNPGNASVTVTDTETLNSSTKTVDDNTTVTYELSGGNVTVMIHDIQTDTTPQRLTADVEIPNQYGWSSGARTVGSNLGVLFIAVAFIIILGLVGSVIN